MSTERPDLDAILARLNRYTAIEDPAPGLIDEWAASALDDVSALLTYARGLEQERDAAQARHDAEIAGIVAMLREQARIDWRAAERFNRVVAEIETTHAAALARHAGRAGGANG